MTKLGLISIFLFGTILNAQSVDAELLQRLKHDDGVGITEVTGTPDEGSIMYDDTQNKLFYYDNTGQWVEILTPGNSAYSDSFVISSTATGSTPPAPVTTTRTITGIPFMPSLINITAHANVESLNQNGSNPTTNGNNINWSFGTSDGYARLVGGNISQQIINGGGSGSSINDISWFASSSDCLGVRYGNNDANLLGLITARVTGFTSNGFVLSITYTPGDVGNTTNRNRVFDEDLVVMFTAYR